jgi:hypothetical protein
LGEQPNILRLGQTARQRNSLTGAGSPADEQADGSAAFATGVKKTSPLANGLDLPGHRGTCAGLLSPYQGPGLVVCDDDERSIELAASTTGRSLDAFGGRE